EVLTVTTASPVARAVTALRSLRWPTGRPTHSERAPRVLFWVFGFPPDFSGATLQTIELAKALRARGVRSSFLAETYDASLPRASVEDGFVVRRILRQSGSLHRFGLSLAWNVLKRAGDFDALFFVGNPGEFWTTAYATSAARMLGKRVFVELNMEFYDGDPLRIRGTRLEATKKWIASKVEKFLPNSSAIARSFPFDLVGDRCELLPYGVDLGRFSPAVSREEARASRVALGLPVDRKVVVAVGAVSRRKNPDFVLRAWRRVCERMKTRPPLLVWVGPAMTIDRENHDGSWVRALVEQADRGALAGNVRFVGHKDRPEEFLRAADAFAFASRQEGSPSVVREALACALPTVALELPGITDELIDDGRNGFLVPVSDRVRFQEWATAEYEDERALETFSDRLVRVLEDPSLAMVLGAKAQETAVRRFSIDARADRVLALLKREG
ncbi:MAG: glycosyltransferase family 4 protein, partial [Planctomycetota bacterium]